jgi:hypothetical protein
MHETLRPNPSVNKKKKKKKRKKAVKQLGAGRGGRK